MGDAVLEIVSKLAPSVVSAVVASWIAVRLALGRYKREALWNRKLEAYAKILEALHVTRLHSEQCAHEVETGLSRNTEHKERNEKRATDAYAELNRAIDTGSLIISEEATRFLDDHLSQRRDAWEHDVPIDFYQDDANATRKALERIKAIARSDLDR